jgi:hypothetical protein
MKHTIESGSGSLLRSTTEYFSRDGFPIMVDLGQLLVVTERLYASRKRKAYFDLSGHPLSYRMCEFLIAHSSGQPAASLVSFASTFVNLLRFFEATSYWSLTAESFVAYLNWLRKKPIKREAGKYKESTRRSYSTFVLRFMDWLLEYGEVKPFDLDAAREAFQKTFKGFNARGLELLRLTAISPDEYVRLIRTVRLEYESCKSLIQQSHASQDEYDVTFPLLPFSILLGAQLGLRSVEFNHLNVGDLRGDCLLLNPPNKKPSVVWLPTGVIACLDLARDWISRHRVDAVPTDPLLICPARERSQGFVRFDTPRLADSLSRFYRKYFNVMSDGKPCLYKSVEEPDSTPEPYSLLFRDFRSAAITEAARHERNPEAVRRFARHTYFSTTLRFYIRETHHQWVNNVALFLRPSAELVRMSLENSVATEVEEKKANASNAAVMGGHCEQALSGDHSCRRAIDCRLCAFFRIHISKRDFFVKEKEAALDQAERMQNGSGLHRDAENLREFAALNEAIINRIDDYLSTGGVPEKVS